MLRLRAYALERKWGRVFRLVLLGAGMTALRLLILAGLPAAPGL